MAQARAIYTPLRQIVRVPQQAAAARATPNSASIRVGVSTLLIREALVDQMRTPLITAALAIVAATFVAMLLAQVTLRPIHVIRSGLARLGRGELDVNVDLPADAELADLGDSFKAVSARLAADRTALADQRATLESVVDTSRTPSRSSDRPARCSSPIPAMRPSLRPRRGDLAHVFAARPSLPRRGRGRRSTRANRSDPMTVQMPGGGERLVLAHPVEDADGDLLGVMLVSRNLSYLSEVESTLSYSRKLAALGRLSAGIAHEVKNPLNATMIHLELLQDAAGRHAERARARGRHRRAGAPARRSRAGLPEVHAARGSAVAAGADPAAHRGADACDLGRGQQTRRRRAARVPARPAAVQADAGCCSRRS